MQKVFSPRFILIIAISLCCIYLTYPTVQYFYHVGQMDENPTPEQIEIRASYAKALDF